MFLSNTIFKGTVFFFIFVFIAACTSLRFPEFSSEGSGEAESGSNSNSDSNIDTQTETASDSASDSVFETDTPNDTEFDSESECVPSNYQECIDGDIYQLNTCNEDLELIESCNDNQNCQTIEPGSVSCNCKAGWIGDDCLVCVRYVDQAVSYSSSKTGLSWQNACEFPQSCIDSALVTQELNGIERCEIWVAGGTYFFYGPDSTSRDTLLIYENIELYGGFASSEASRDERDWQTNVTVFDGRDPLDENNRLYHVVKIMGDTIIDGFTITGGHANESLLPLPTKVTRKGGGLAVYEGTARVANCKFFDNKAQTGGALWAEYVSVENCVFENNESTDWGGAISGDLVDISNSVFIGNWASKKGAAIFVPSDTTADHSAIINSIFYSNSAQDGDVTGIEQEASFTIEVTNNIFWNNQADNIAEINTALDITYSLVQGGFEGDGNISEKPLFKDTDNADLTPREDSPSIDAANGAAAPATDLNGNTRRDEEDMPNIGLGPPWADIGAFEY